MYTFSLFYLFIFILKLLFCTCDIQQNSQKSQTFQNEMLKLRCPEGFGLLFRNFVSIDLHLSSIQIEKFSPLAQPKCALLEGEAKAEEGQRGWEARKEGHGKRADRRD